MIKLCPKCFAPMPQLHPRCFTCVPPKEPREFAFRYFVPAENNGRTLKDLADENE